MCGRVKSENWELDDLFPTSVESPYTNAVGLPVATAIQALKCPFRPEEKSLQVLKKSPFRPGTSVASFTLPFLDGDLAKAKILPFQKHFRCFVTTDLEKRPVGACNKRLQSQSYDDEITHRCSLGNCYQGSESRVGLMKQDMRDILASPQRWFALASSMIPYHDRSRGLEYSSSWL